MKAGEGAGCVDGERGRRMGWLFKVVASAATTDPSLGKYKLKHHLASTETLNIFLTTDRCFTIAVNT